MELTREEALKYHKQMWSDMQRELGDCPSFGERAVYKEKWCKDHFPNEKMHADCILCEYVGWGTTEYGTRCPIDWGNNEDIACEQIPGHKWYDMPISELLALPEREIKDD